MSHGGDVGKFNITQSPKRSKAARSYARAALTSSSKKPIKSRCPAHEQHFSIGKCLSVGRQIVAWRGWMQTRTIIASTATTPNTNPSLTFNANTDTNTPHPRATNLQHGFPLPLHNHGTLSYGSRTRERDADILRAPDPTLGPPQRLLVLPRVCRDRRQLRRERGSLPACPLWRHDTDRHGRPRDGQTAIGRHLVSTLALPRPGERQPLPRLRARRDANVNAPGRPPCPHRPSRNGGRPLWSLPIPPHCVSTLPPLFLPTALATTLPLPRKGRLCGDLAQCHWKRSGGGGMKRPVRQEGAAQHVIVVLEATEGPGRRQRCSNAFMRGTPGVEARRDIERERKRNEAPVPRKICGPSPLLCLPIARL